MHEIAGTIIIQKEDQVVHEIDSSMIANMTTNEVVAETEQSRIDIDTTMNIIENDEIR